MDTQKKMRITNFKIMRRVAVEEMTGLSRSSLYAKMANGCFPKPVKLGERSVGWLEHEIQEWLQSKVIATREGGAQ